VENRGLFDDHAYSLLSVHQLDGDIRLLKIRNPWGSNEWTGDWSDSSDKWTPELKA
jgi:calpain-15